MVIGTAGLPTRKQTNLFTNMIHDWYNLKMIPTPMKVQGNQMDLPSLEMGTTSPYPMVVSVMKQNHKDVAPLQSSAHEKSTEPRNSQQSHTKSTIWK
mmetsp:Transcript_96665/g.166623  ORF Transcript_96665/g.166623 Transcript_96665/m.166623 type:complete len:97 (-) Transcript_96665:1307-1597(-)